MRCAYGIRDVIDGQARISRELGDVAKLVQAPRPLRWEVWYGKLIVARFERQTEADGYINASRAPENYSITDREKA